MITLFIQGYRTYIFDDVLFMTSISGNIKINCNCIVNNVCEIKIDIVSDIYACNVLFFIGANNHHNAKTYMTGVDRITHYGYTPMYRGEPS